MFDQILAVLFIVLLGYSAQKTVRVIGYRAVAVGRYELFNYAYQDGKRFLTYLLYRMGPYVISGLLGLHKTSLVLATWFLIDSVTILLGLVNYRKWSE